jgi:hypothetical protein
MPNQPQGQKRKLKKLSSFAVLFGLMTAILTLATSIAFPEETKIGKNFYLSGSSECEFPGGYILNGKRAPKLYSRWHLRLDRHAVLFWNGSRTDGDVIRVFLRDLERVKSSSEYLSVEIEPGASCNAVKAMRVMVVNSGLCSQGRCTENSWNLKIPIVN